MHIMHNFFKVISFMQNFLCMLLMHNMQNLVRILCRTYAELMHGPWTYAAGCAQMHKTC